VAILESQHHLYNSGNQKPATKSKTKIKLAPQKSNSERGNQKMPSGGNRPGSGRSKGTKNGAGKPRKPRSPKAPKALLNEKTREQTAKIVDKALKRGDTTPLSAMLKNLQVIAQKADEMLESGVPVDDTKHLALRKMLQDIAGAVAPYCHPRLSAIASVTTTAPAADAAPDHSATDAFIARIQHLADRQKQLGLQQDDGRQQEPEVIPPPTLPRVHEPPNVRPRPPDLDLKPERVFATGEWKDCWR
jgi:hypothetical protein